MVFVKAGLMVLWLSQDVKKETDVVVSASRLEEPAADVASSVTVIPGSLLQAAQQRMVLEALREVPSVDVVPSGAPGGLTAVFLRGADSGQTLVLVDGVEANNPVASERAFDFAHLSTDNVERIEVLRGPQSVLYGSDAMGGVIHVITRRGQGDPKVRFTAEAGSYGTYRGAAALGGGNETANYSLEASRLQTSGFSSADEDDDNTEKDGYRNQTISARVGVTPSKIVDGDVTVRGIESRSEVDNFGGPGGDDPNHVLDFSQWMFRAAPRVRLLDGAWEQTFSAAVMTLDFQDNNPADTASGGAFTISSFEAQLVDLDWQHTLTLHESQVLVVGAEFEEETAQSFTEDSFFGTSVLRKRSAWTRSAYAQHRMHLWDRLMVSGGVRADTHEEFGTRVTWRGTGAYAVSSTATKLRGTVGTGFKAPSLFQLFSSFGDPTLDAEESLGWDLGFDQDLPGDRATVSATYFRNEFEDLIDFDGATSRFMNLGRAETEGLEVAVRVRVVDGLEARLSYTRLDAEDKDADEDLIRRARHRAGARLLYAVADGVQVTASAVWVGNRPDLDFSTFPATRVTLDDYTLVGLAASWRVGGGVEVFARGENLLDQEYQDIVGFGVPEASVYAGAAIDF